MFNTRPLIYEDSGLKMMLQTFEDGSLYISNLGLHHMGNYTCQDRNDEHVVQTHIVRVQGLFIIYMYAAPQ